MEDDKYLPAWVIRNLDIYGNSVVPNNIINRFGTWKIQLLLRHILEDDTIIIEDVIWYDQHRNGRLRKRIGYHAKKGIR